MGIFTLWGEDADVVPYDDLVAARNQFGIEVRDWCVEQFGEIQWYPNQDVRIDNPIHATAFMIRWG